jgi:hypothetical protein
MLLSFVGLDQAAPAPQHLAIISAMITPAILILAAGSLVNSTLTRLARIVDRARALIDQASLSSKSGDEAATQIVIDWLAMYLRRTALAERALTMFYAAIGMFVAGSLAITLDSITHGALPWLPASLVILGAVFLFIGTLTLVVETHLAAGILRREIEQGMKTRAGS